MRAALLLLRNQLLRHEKVERAHAELVHSTPGELEEEEDDEDEAEDEDEEMDCRKKNETDVKDRRTDRHSDRQTDNKRKLQTRHEEEAIADDERCARALSLSSTREMAFGLARARSRCCTH